MLVSHYIDYLQYFQYILYNFWYANFEIRLHNQNKQFKVGGYCGEW